MHVLNLDHIHSKSHIFSRSGHITKIWDHQLIITSFSKLGKKYLKSQFSVKHPQVAWFTNAFNSSCTSVIFLDAYHFGPRWGWGDFAWRFKQDWYISPKIKFLNTMKKSPFKDKQILQQWPPKIPPKRPQTITNKAAQEMLLKITFH